MNTPDEMAPAASPGTTTKKAGIRRVNNLPVYIGGALVTIFLTIMALVAADRAKSQSHQHADTPEKTTSTSQFADELAGKQADGIIPAAKATPPTLTDQPPAPATPPPSESLDAPPLPPRMANEAVPIAAGQEQKERIAQMKQQQLEDAIKAATAVREIAPRSPASSTVKTLNGHEETIQRIAALQQQIDAQTGDDPTTAYQARLAQLRHQGISPTGGTQAALASSGSNAPPSPSAKDYRQFAADTAQDRWRLDNEVQAPRSPYELRAGFVIPALLISGLNSDLPGQVIGQVSQDVFDTATGKWKLIPQGSRLVGQYSSDIAYGQARVLVAWQRIIFPDGKALDIGAMPGSDSAGYAGFHDQVNNHYMRLFGSALLMSGVTAGIAMSQREQYDPTRISARAAMTEALGQQLGHTTAQLISRNLSIAPTLEIRPGFRFNVVVIKDLTFSKPYVAFDY